MSGPDRVILARHGETEYESEYMGAAGGSLTALGRAQARDLGERLRSSSVTAVYCSELSRGVQTAEIAAALLGLPVTVRVGIHEYPAGDYLGRPYDAKFFDAMVTSWLAGDLAVQVPGGESGDQVADRVLQVLEDLVRRHPGETVLVVSHGGVVLALMGRLAPGSTMAPRSGLEVANGSSYVLERDADGWQVRF